MNEAGREISSGYLVVCLRIGWYVRNSYTYMNWRDMLGAGVGRVGLPAREMPDNPHGHQAWERAPLRHTRRHPPTRRQCLGSAQARRRSSWLCWYTSHIFIPSFFPSFSSFPLSHFFLVHFLSFSFTISFFFSLPIFSLPPSLLSIIAFSFWPCWLRIIFLTFFSCCLRLYFPFSFSFPLTYVSSSVFLEMFFPSIWIRICKKRQNQFQMLRTGYHRIHIQKLSFRPFL